MLTKKTKVILVEDSPIKREILIHILKSDSTIDVVGYAPDSISALKLLETLSPGPDVITIDIDLPGGMNGFELTQLILKTKAIPIVIISSLRTKDNQQDIENAMLKSGAIYFLDSPHSPWNPEFQNDAKEILRIIKLVSGKTVPTIQSSISLNIPHIGLKNNEAHPCGKIIVIGSSTGGPQILQNIFSQLSPSFSIPIVVVQHISKGFDEITVRLLQSSCPISIKLAENNDIIKSKCIYVAPADKIIEIKNNQLVLTPFPENYNGYKPSVSHLFESAIRYRENAVGIILTGMGKDGALELKKMKEAGAITIAQSEASCTVFGMPKEAINCGGAKYIFSPNEIINFLNGIN